MTMREIYREYAAGVERAREQHDRDMVCAWTTANLVRARGKMPKLHDLLSRKPATRLQSVQEQAAMWQIAAMRFGGSFRPLDPATKIVRH